MFLLSVSALREFPLGIKVEPSKFLPPVCDYGASGRTSASQVVPAALGMDLFPTLLVWRRPAGSPCR